MTSHIPPEAQALIDARKMAFELVDENDTLRTRILELTEERDRLLSAINWALGEGDSEFGDNVPKARGHYWWRTELRARAALNPTPKEAKDG